MTSPAIQRNSTVPIHGQLRMVLASEIDAGAYPDGRLPSEAKLCERFGVSRVTLRRALSDLEAQGLVARVHGKGTFVKEHSIRPAQMSMDSHADRIFVGDERVASSRIVREIKLAERIPASLEIAKLCEVEEGHEVYHLQRVFSLDDGAPLSLDDAYYDAERFPGFLERISDKTSTYQVLQDEYDVQFGTTERAFNVAFIDDTVAGWLDRPPRDAVLQIVKVVYDTDDRVVHVSNLLSIPSRVEVSARFEA